MYKPINETYNQTIAPVIEDFLKDDLALADRAINLRIRRRVGVAGLALYALTMFSIGAPSIARAEIEQQTSAPVSIETLQADSLSATITTDVYNAFPKNDQNKSKDARVPVPIYNSESGELLPVFGQQNSNGYLANETNNENSIDALVRQGQEGSQNPEKNIVEKLFTLEYRLDQSIGEGKYGEAALLAIPNCAVKLSLGTIVGVLYPLIQTGNFVAEANNYSDPDERLGHLIGRAFPPFFAMFYIGNFFSNIWNYITKSPWDFGVNTACSLGLAAGLGAFDGGSARKAPAPTSTTPAPLPPVEGGGI